MLEHCSQAKGTWIAWKTKGTWLNLDSSFFPFPLFLHGFPSLFLPLTSLYILYYLSNDQWKAGQTGFSSKKNSVVAKLLQTRETWESAWLGLLQQWQKIVQQLCGFMKLWDPGISQAETIFFYPGSFLAGGDRLVHDRMPPWDRNSSPRTEGTKSVHSVFDKLSSWCCDGFYPWIRNTLRNGNDKHLNIMDVSNGDLLLHIHEAWSHIRAEQIIKSAKCGHFNTLQQLACFWEYVCSTCGLQFNLCQISAVKAHIVLKVSNRSWSAINVATQCSCFWMHQIEYTDQSVSDLLFFNMATWSLYRWSCSIKYRLNQG
jgi:hypothetical protein